MKQHFIKQQNNNFLILFFSGWGMDENSALSIIKENYDTCICFDYTDLTFDKSQYTNYQIIDIYGWSMGVWAASLVLQSCNLPIRNSTAINGTVYPIDWKKGIHPEIFQKTIDFLSESNLLNFYKRMCGNRQNFQKFREKTPLRSLSDLKKELISIQKMVKETPVPQFTWNKAIIGKNDLIFQMENQQRAWKNIKYQIVEEAHFLDFKKYVD